MRHRLGQQKGFTASLLGLVRIAAYPQGDRHKGMAADPRVMPAVTKGMEAMLLKIVKRLSLLKVIQRGRKVSTPKQGSLKGMIRL
jgi:hypothetical protein